jgi:hypothetical protein
VLITLAPEGGRSRADYDDIRHWIFVGKEDWYTQHWITVNNPALKTNMVTASYSIMFMMNY